MRLYLQAGLLLSAVSVTALFGCTRSTGVPAVTVTQVVTATPHASAEGGSDVRQMLHDAGANEASIHALAVVAQSAGYVWQSRPPTEEEAENFAYMALLECREIASGGRTWRQSFDDALSSGASGTQATTYDRVSAEQPTVPWSQTRTLSARNGAGRGTCNACWPTCLGHSRQCASERDCEEPMLRFSFS